MGQFPVSAASHVDCFWVARHSELDCKYHAKGCRGYDLDQIVNLAPGTKLGPYEIGAPFGAGGIGEVYRARDTRLERTVAIKISL